MLLLVGVEVVMVNAATFKGQRTELKPAQSRTAGTRS